MKKTTFLTAAIFALCLALTVSAATPDYSGVWELDVGKSTLSNTTFIESIKMKVWQTENELRIENYTKVKQNQNNSVARENVQLAIYQLDDQEVTTGAENGGTMTRSETRKASLAADGKINLVVTRTFNNQNGNVTTKNNEIWQLLDDGKTLKMVRLTESPRGTTSSEMYFKKSNEILGEPNKTINTNPNPPRVVFDPAAQNNMSTPMLVRRAIKLVKPDYPAAARPSRAQGAVTVKVTLDETGEVIAAEAISGDPLLRSAAEKAARKSKFSPEIVDGKPVKITGVIVYNFMP